MVHYCAVFGCRERFKSGGSISFHKFPRHDARCKVWTKAMRRKNFTPTEHSRICSKHFTKECYDFDAFGRSRKLKADAVPSIFEFHAQKKGMTPAKKKKNVVKEVQPHNEETKLEELPLQGKWQKTELAEQAYNKKTRLHVCFTEAPLGDRERYLTVEFDRIETCRLCLKRSEMPVEIFTQEKLSYSKLYKINTLLGIEMTENDGLPRVICEACSARLEDLFLFHMECQNSNTILSASVELSSRDSQKKVISVILQTSSKQRAIDIYKECDEGIRKEKDSAEISPPKCSADENGCEKFDEESAEEFDDVESQGSNTGMIHLKQNPLPPRFHCPYCTKSFATKPWLLRHKKTHTEVNHNASYIASPIVNEFKKKKAVLTEISQIGHKSSSNSVNDSSCEYGETLEDIERFVSNSQNGSSVNIYGDTEGQFLCDICEQHFDNKQEFKNHRTEHFVSEMYSDLPFSHSQGVLKDSTSTTKRKNTTSIQSIPDKKRKSVSAKKQKGFAVGKFPTIKRNKIIKKYVCVYCSKIIVGRDSLLDHQRKHKEDQPRVCKICTKTLQTEEQLALCVQSHKGDPNGDFACKVCGICFHCRSFVEFHAKILHMDLVKQKYKCNQCKEIFDLETDLLLHLITHCEKNRPKSVITDSAKKESLVCQFCNTMFITLKSLEKHILKWHSSSEEAGPVQNNADFSGHFARSKKSTSDLKSFPMLSKNHIAKAVVRSEVDSEELKKHTVVVHPRNLAKSNKLTAKKNVKVTNIHSAPPSQDLPALALKCSVGSNPSNLEDHLSESCPTKYRDRVGLVEHHSESEVQPEDCNDPHVGCKICFVGSEEQHAEEHHASSLKHVASSDDDRTEIQFNLPQSDNTVEHSVSHRVELKECVQNPSGTDDISTKCKDHIEELANFDAESAKIFSKSEHDHTGPDKHTKQTDVRGNDLSNCEDSIVVSKEYLDGFAAKLDDHSADSVEHLAEEPVTKSEKHTASFVEHSADICDQPASSIKHTYGYEDEKISAACIVRTANSDEHINAASIESYVDEQA